MISTATANLLQYFSLPAELIGVMLAYIEIRHPVIANKLSAYIVEYEKLNAEVSISDNVPVVKAAIIISIFLLIGFLTIILDPPDWIIYGPVAVLVSILIAIFIASRWIPKRALGTIGLMIASFGLLIELYQFVALVSAN